MNKTIVLRTAILAVAMAMEPGAYAAGRQKVDVPAGDLAIALEALAKQSGAEYIYDVHRLRGITTQGVHGELTAEQALAKLLEGTKLRMTAHESGAILISDAQGDEPVKTTAEPPQLGVMRLAQAEQGDFSPSSAEDQRDKNTENLKSDSAAGDSDNKLEEVVVTAQRRIESLQGVAMSISVLGGAELDRSTASSVATVLNNTPSISLNAQTGGIVGGSVISLRGVSNSSYREGGASTVAYYVDGTPYGLIRSATIPLDANPYDLERIEVLRGPQGTLYGANALNGVIRVITHDADPNNFDAKARAYVSNTESGGLNSGVDAALNLPLVTDRLAVRLSGGYRDNSGWIDSPIREDVNDQTSKNVRLKVHAGLSDTLSLNLSAWHSETTRGAPNMSTEDRRITSVEDERGSISFDVFGAELVKEFNGFSVTSNTSYMDLENFGILDGTPITFPATLATTLTSRIFTEEVNVVSDGDGDWTWSLGAFYRDAEDFTDQILGFTGGGPTFVNNDYVDRSKSHAIYGELGRYFLDRTLQLTVGLRYFQDDSTLRLQSAYLPLPLTPFETSADATTPRIVLAWRPDQDRTFYASYSEGFRSGLVQAPNVQVADPTLPAADPDLLRNYELGARGRMFGRLLDYDVAVYYIDWQDAQQSLEILLNNGLTASAVVNAVAASGFGAEASLTLHPDERWDIGGFVSHNGVNYGQNVRNAGGTIVLPEGGRLVGSPEWTAGASINYNFPFANGFKGEVGLTGAYRSTLTVYRSSSSSPTTFESAVGEYRFDGGNLHFSVRAPTNWALRLFIDNLTDNYSTEDPVGQNILVPASFEWRARQRPRTIGVQLEYRFGRQ